MDQMEIRREPGRIADATIIRLDGPLTLTTLFPLQGLLRDHTLGNVVIDLTGVPYMDSAGLGVLLAHWSHARRSGGRFALAAISPRVMTIFEITHTDTTMPIFPSAEEAERAFVKGTGAGL
jgi:anti-anti-sigma factor